ncbi:MAG: ABC transporter ATP-binding protein, partial [Oscillospiraceae bacterium]|nr:ABC transporter ATP-binding protein [Oscillospiraceae bacterium]
MKRDTSSLKWIFKRIRSYAFWLFVLIVMVTFVSYINVQFALVSKRLIDVATNQTAGSVVDSALLLGALLIVQLLLQVLYIRIHIKISGKLAMSMRTDLFYQLMKKDYAGVSALHSGEILNRLVSDVSLVAEKVTEMIPNVVALLSTVVFSFIALYQLDKQLAVVCLAFGPVIMAAAYIYKKRIKHLHLKCRESDGRVRAFLQESIQNLLVIKVFNRADVMRQRSGGLQLENFHLNVKRATVGILANVLFFVAVTAGYYAALAWSVYRLSIGVITFGTVTAVLGLVGQLQTPFREIASLFPQFYMVLASAERLMELESLKESTPLLVSKEEDVNAFQSIDFCDVCFSYGDVKVLDNVNLSVKRGEFVALCGNSGAGKSTLSKLMLS